MTDPTQYLLVPICEHARHEYTRPMAAQVSSRVSVSPASLAGMLDEAVATAAVRGAATLGQAINEIMDSLILDLRSPYAFHVVTQTTWTRPQDLVMCAAAAVLEYRCEPNPTCTIIAAAAVVAHTRFTLFMKPLDHRPRPPTSAAHGPFHLVRPGSASGDPTGFKEKGPKAKPKIHLYKGGALSGLGLREYHIERGQPGPSPVLALAPGGHSTIELACVFGRLLQQGMEIYRIGSGGVASPWPVMLSRSQVTELPEGIIAVPPSLVHRLRREPATTDATIEP